VSKNDAQRAASRISIHFHTFPRYNRGSTEEMRRTLNILNKRYKSPVCENYSQTLIWKKDCFGTTRFRWFRLQNQTLWNSHLCLPSSWHDPPVCWIMWMFNYIQRVDPQNRGARIKVLPNLPSGYLT
jgi:hypothetical protein